MNPRATKDTEVLRDPILDEEVHRRVFPSGLTVYAVRKTGFTKSYATLATRYGSLDTALPRGGPALPDGIAHFLEHKVFETEEGDAFELFAARGASPNAFTSHTSTRYLFGTSSEYAGNLRTLLDTVFDLHVTEAGVEKEKGIIGQEIAMYRDHPAYRLYQGTVECIYRRHPMRLDVAGTEHSISGITADLLRRVHRAFYHPRIMTLAAVSPEPIAETFRAVEECVESRRFGPAPGRRKVAPEGTDVVPKRSFRLKMSVARPRVLLSFKDQPPGRGGRRQLRQELVSTIVLDCLFGNSGALFLDLYESGLIDESFSYTYSCEPSYAFALLGGETDDADRLRRALDRRIARAREEGIPAEDFERVRNKVLGGYARAFNAPARIAHMLVRHHLRGTTVTDYRDLIFRVKRSEVNRRLRELLVPSARTYAVLEPK